MKAPMQIFPKAEPARRDQRLDVLAAGNDPLRQRRFGFAPVATPTQERDGVVAGLTPDEVRKLVAAGVIRFPQTEGAR